MTFCCYLFLQKNSAADVWQYSRYKPLDKAHSKGNLRCVIVFTKYEFCRAYEDNINLWLE